MTPHEKLAIFGAGGHAREVAFIAERCGIPPEAMAFVVEASYRRETKLNGIEVHTIESGYCDGWPFVAAVGDPILREHAARLCESRGMVAATLRDPSVELHRTVVLGEGCILFPGAVTTVNLTLGAHVHINVASSLSHDCRVGDYSILSPGARLAGHVHVGSHVFIGIGASVVNGSTDEPMMIGDNAFVAAGACVTGPVADGARVMGVPARSH
jgi:sugar O-acyltransferase (sialic acid O-acetyltransferase NeuD family)